MTPPHPSAIAEREAIVRWLRSDAQALQSAGGLANDLVAEGIGEAADAIERGEHLPQSKE